MDATVRKKFVRAVTSLDIDIGHTDDPAPLLDIAGRAAPRNPDQRAPAIDSILMHFGRRILPRRSVGGFYRREHVPRCFNGTKFRADAEPRFEAVGRRSTKVGPDKGVAP